MLHEAISVFDIFKIGVGPSSSHTLGPWVAALQCIEELKKERRIEFVENIDILLYGSLAKTGIGHGTGWAIQLGLCGENPKTFPTDEIQTRLQEIKDNSQLLFAHAYPINFHPAKNIQYLKDECLPYHPNGLSFLIRFRDGIEICKTFYSIGGGFVTKDNDDNPMTTEVDLPFPINKAKDLETFCIKTGLSISELVLENESAWRGEEETKNELAGIWQVMKECIYRGCHQAGELPGGLQVQRRAKSISSKLLQNQAHSNYEEWTRAIRSGGNAFKYTLDWLSCFALAVNEENASFSRVVTAPTNGAAGVIPAVLQYILCFHECREEETVLNFLLTAGEIGSIFKKNATISAAMGGCQAEIGVSSAMAAAALCEFLGGTIKQCLMAAEIAMEHHLGMTCDPIGGLVQIPCIERNAMGAIKAITAAQLALQGNPYIAKVSLDKVIKSMLETAKDMNSKYKETSDGGLAVQIPLSLPEC